MTVSFLVGFLVLPIASQQAKQAKAAQNATEHKARLVFAFGFIKINAITENGQVSDDADDIADGTAGLVGLFQQVIIGQKGNEDQRSVYEVLGGFLGNHDYPF